MKSIFLAVVAITLAVNVSASDRKYAKGSENNANSNSNSLSHSSSRNHVSTRLHNKAAGGQAESYAVGGSAQGGSVGNVKAVSGAATAEGGSVGNVTGGGGGSAQNGDITISDTSPRQAPGVALVAPQSTMDCSKGIGWGGSNKTGSMLVGWSWLQRDCFALKQFTLFANLGMPEAASKSFCSRKLLWAPFESQENCQAVITQSLISVQIDRAEVAGGKKNLGR